VTGEAAEVQKEVGQSESSLAAMGQALHNSDDETALELKNERTARLKALEDERQSAIQETSNLLEQISTVAQQMSSVAGTSADKQRTLINKLASIKEVLEAEADKAKASSGSALNELEAQEDALKRTADKAVRWEGDFSTRVQTQSSQQADKLGNLEEDSKGMIEDEMAALGETQNAADGSIQSSEKNTKKAAIETGARAASDMVKELNQTQGYMAETSAAVNAGLAQEQAEVESLKNESTHQITMEMREDALLNKKVMGVGMRIQTQDLKLSRLQDLIESKLKAVEETDDANVEEAAQEIDALEKKVSGFSLLEGAATRKAHGKEEKMLQNLEQKVAASEARTRHYEEENEQMRQRLEHMVKAELQRELDAELSGQ